MARIKKYISAWVLLLIMAAPLLAMTGYWVQKWYLRHEMRERLETEALHTLVLQPEEIRWAEKGKELWIHDQLFDVKSMQLTAKGYVVMGLFDHEETTITKKASQQVNEQTDDESQAALQLLLLTIYQSIQNDIAITAPAVKLPVGYPIYQAATCFIPMGVATPPPDQV